MHKPILRRVGLVLILVSVLQLAWTIYLATRSHSVSFDFTFLVAGICLMFGSLSTARFIRRFAALGLVLLGGLAVLWIATEPFSSTIAKLRTLTLETAGDLVGFVVWMVMCAWTIRELSRPEIMADAVTTAPPEQSTTSAARQVRYRRGRAGP